MQKIERLIRTIENLENPEARTSAIALMQALMEFHGDGLDRMMEIVAEKGDVGYQLFDQFAADQTIGSLLLLYGLHPFPVETRVVKALDKVRPYLDSHGGNVELLSISQGVVKLRMEGSCKSCPSSSMTLKLAIEEAIYAMAPDVVAIEAEGVTAVPAPKGLVQINKSDHSNGSGANQQSGNGRSSGWETVAELDSLDSSAIHLKEVGGHSIIFCRLGESLYAYGNSCPSCNQPLKGAYLQLNNLICSHCNQQYDLIRAGRGLDQPDLHLQPFPLLFEQGTAKVALPPG